MPRSRRAIGLMSGTSLDGIDAAMLTTDGQDDVERGRVRHLAYGADFRKELRSALDFARGHKRPAEIRAELAETEKRLTVLHGEIVRELIAETGLRNSDIDVIGFHGQTVLHRPGDGVTVQIGDGAWLAGELGIPVVDHFRVADVAAGGEGAPFAPAYHRALARGLPGPVVVVNIGGVANVTYIDRDDDPIAFDTGPGNAMIDDWVFGHTGEPCDRGGALARAGKVDGVALTALMKHPYFAKKPPKSLDRNDFSPEPIRHLSLEDGAATLTAFTAEVISLARTHFPAAPKLWVVTGGGRHNPTLMEELAHRAPGEVTAAESVGWRGDDIEAEAFAYLAVRHLEALPLSWPSTTGVPEPAQGGILHVP